MKSLTAFIFLIFAISSACAQNDGQVLDWINNVSADNKNFYLQIPFEYRNGEIVIQVKIGNRNYDYIFDTGGYNNLTDAMQAEHNFPVLASRTVGSANKIKADVNIVKVDTLAIGSLVFKDVAMLQMDYSNVPTIQCTINGGLIGASIIKKYIWRIDYTNQIITVTDKKEILNDLDRSSKIPVTFDKRVMPYIEVEIDGHKEKLLFDLGSSTAFSMTRKSARKHGRSARAVPILGGGTEGGNGFIQQDVVFFKADSIKIGSSKYIGKPIVSAAKNNVDLIGNPIIKDFVITLNFPENEMYLQPITDLQEGWSNFGFSLGFKEGTVKVITLYKGFEAEKKGLKLGDIIFAIDGKEIQCDNYCECLKVLPDQLRSMDTVTLTVLRNAQAINISFKKEKIY